MVEADEIMGVSQDHRADDLKRLIAVMRNPRYWRDRDPELLHLVELGFRQIYRRHEPRRAPERMPEAERRVA